MGEENRILGARYIKMHREIGKGEGCPRYLRKINLNRIKEVDRGKSFS